MQTFFDLLCETDTSERIDPKTFDISKLYDDMNRDIFGGQLPKVPITFGKVPKEASGITRAKVDPTTLNRRVPKRFAYRQAKVVPESIHVIMQSLPFSYETLRGLVVHEMVHVHNFVNHEIDVPSHGPHFHRRLREAQSRADFTIPLTDTSDTSERFSAPKRVGFLVGERTSDKKLTVSLFTPSLMSNLIYRSHINRLAHALITRCRWVAAGIGRTSLHGAIPVARSLTPVGGIKYWLPRVEGADVITPETVLVSIGDVPKGFEQSDQSTAVKWKLNDLL